MNSSFEDKTDIDLIRIIQETKDVNLFGILYDRYTNMVYNRCFSFVNNSWEAEDLTHDIFLKAYLKLSTFKGDSKFSTWIYSLTVNLCIDYVRKRRIQFAEIDISELNKYLSNDAVEETLIRIKAEKLSQMLEIIPPEDKMILLLKYQDDYSIQELAQMFKIGQSAVKMRLARAREKVVLLYKTQFEEVKT